MKIDTSKTPAGFISTMTPTLGHMIHAVEGGAADCAQKIVMIHGALASRRYLIPTAIQLAQSMQVYVPEMPGHGKSSKPKHALSVKELADTIFEWIQLKKLGQVNIFANSYGCQVAAQLAAIYPQIVSNLILTDATVDPTARTLIQEFVRLYIDGFSEPKGAQGQFFADIWDMGLPRAFETGRHMLEDDIRLKLPKIKCPTLVVRGEKDPISPQKWNEYITSHIPHARLSVIPNAPHCVNYATPVQLAELILEFIKDSGTNGKH